MILHLPSAHVFQVRLPPSASGSGLTPQCFTLCRAAITPSNHETVAVGRQDGHHLDRSFSGPKVAGSSIARCFSNGFHSDGASSSAANVSNSLLETFRTILTETDSYITLFESRIKLEEDYIKNLRATLERQKELDSRINAKIVGDVALMPDAQRYPALRRVWLEMRQNDQRELEARSYMVETYRQAVLAPLLAFRDSQERIRRRVKEDARTSFAQYDEMRNVDLPKIRRAYERKAEEVEHVQLQAQAVEDQRMLLSTKTSDRETNTLNHNRGPSASDFEPTSMSPPPPSPSSAAVAAAAACLVSCGARAADVILADIRTLLPNP